jgi:hypothetical protein
MRTFKRAALTAGFGSEVIWVASTGTHVHITGYRLDITGNASISPAGAVDFYVEDSSNRIVLPLASVALPATAGNTFGGYSTGWVDLGASQATHIDVTDTLYLYSSVTIETGKVVLSLAGYEELGTAPIVAEIRPRTVSTSGGDVVTVTGANFELGSAMPTVAVDGELCFVYYVGPTQLAYVTPAHAPSPGGPGNFDIPVVITTSEGTAGAVHYYYDPGDLPTITSLDIASVTVGSTDTITATGINFNSYNEVDFVFFLSVAPPINKTPIDYTGLGGVSPVTYVSDTELTFQIGELPVGDWYVVPGYVEDLIGTSQVQLTVSPA